MTYKLDANHNELSTDAQRLGIVVVDNAKVKRDEPGQLDVWWGIPNPYGGAAVWVWVEYKTEVGDESKEQKRWIKECQEAGLPVEVVRNTDEVIDVFEKYRDLMWDIELTKAQLKMANAPGDGASDGV